ncbi:hypothetical protein HU200_006141 [Digitaria exilis]|uniref:Uncharacterized protein n=1 Tax=Digitaria exilis TaxID=1010633 RepID=A0A835KQY5_9POAL|nr:hypothetical protein HU200_006141 [Digitaria exilis]
MTAQRTAKDRLQHLYLVFDDWHSGYSIRKVSLSRRSGKRVGSGEGAEPLPEVFMRIQADRGYSRYFTSAFGTKILAIMHLGIADGFPGFLMIDVEERCLVYGPKPNYNAYPIYFPVSDNKLFVLDIGTFHCYLMPKNSDEPWGRKHLPFPPFDRVNVSSYGVLPDGFVLLSTKRTTFILDTKEYVWKPYGNWVVPFTGRGHYDTSLEGFVGLSKDPETLGYLYCCTMASIGTGDTLHPSPGFKCSKEKVFNKNPAERHVSANLLHMRPGKFCIVECVSIEKGRADQELREPGAAGGGCCYMYRVKTFSLGLGYDAKGDLKLKDSRVRCYSLPQEVTNDFLYHDGPAPAAFWL